MKHIFMTTFTIALLGAILCSNSINAPLLICFAIAMISFGIAYAIEYREVIKDRAAWLVAQIIIAYRKRVK